MDVILKLHTRDTKDERAEIRAGRPIASAVLLGDRRRQPTPRVVTTLTSFDTKTPPYWIEGMPTYRKGWRLIIRSWKSRS